MRRIAAWVAILAVLTMIVGIYGMNFGYMPELRSRYGYFVVLGVMAAVSGIIYTRFKRTTGSDPASTQPLHMRTVSDRLQRGSARSCATGSRSTKGLARWSSPPLPPKPDRATAAAPTGGGGHD